MHIAASAIGEYLHPDIGMIRVLHADGTLWKDQDYRAVQILADRRLIDGTGSHVRLRYVKLKAAANVAEDEIERQSRADSVRGRLQHSQASQTCVRDSQVAVRDGRIGTFTTYRHVRGWAFSLGERLRQARLDAERGQLATA